MIRTCASCALVAHYGERTCRACASLLPVEARALGTVDGAAPLLVLLIAVSLAAMALRACEVEVPDEAPLFVEVGDMGKHETCEHCGVTKPRKMMAPYFVGDVLRHACEDDACRERARAEMRGEVETRRAA
jgi:hypothetical protein